MLRNDIPTEEGAEEETVIMIDENGNYIEINRKEKTDGTDHDSGAGDNDRQ